MGEKFSANPLTGTASLTVPVSMTPGRGDVAPQLVLSYDSGAGNGCFGVGWSLDVASVSRRTDKGLPRYDTDDVFQLTGAEDLVPAAFPAPRAEGSFDIVAYRPRTEGLFSRIEQWRDRDSGDTHWRATSRDNLTSVFGRDPAARIADPDDPSRVFRWLIEQTTDDRGNVVSYEYKREDRVGVDQGAANERNRSGVANRHLKRLRYGNRQPGVADDFCFEAVLDYGEHNAAAPAPDEDGPWPVRADPFSSYRPGFDVRTYRLCRRILMFHRFLELGDEPVLVASTVLDYQQDPALTLLTSITHCGHVKTTAGYSTQQLPALKLTYTDRVVATRSGVLSTERAEPPVRLDAGYRWTDLDGEGAAGILAESDGAWYYRRNLGGGAVGGPRAVDPLPIGAGLAAGRRLLDLAGDGRQALTDLAGTARGFHLRTDDRSWSDFVPFTSLPSLSWSDANLQFVDLTGDGIADVLVTGDDGFTWYPSAGLDGFTDAHQISAPASEERGPRLMFADLEQCVYLADMTGDGLTDLVRVRNGEIAYWPNLGYGRFGGKITMSGAPVFDHPDRFDQRRIRLSDVDGSAPTDLLYLGADGVRVWFNQAGNSWSAPERIDLAVPPDVVGSTTVTDLLGAGTACLVVAQPRPDGEPEVGYVNLMAAGKPHLLSTLDNGMGRSTIIRYASSTSFYLADEAAGRPWVTRLPFPVQVVAEVDTNDAVAGTSLVATYSYRHGYFDGVEREFRGFGFVEQRDALADAAGTADDLHQPPAVTRRWQHTGWYLDGGLISKHFASEYWHGGAGLTVPDSTLPDGVTPEEEREAARALRGRVLREEIYAEDGTAHQGDPYTITESNYHVRLTQPKGSAPYCVVFAHPGEILTVHSEREIDDPRVTHTVTLAVDDWGNVLRSAQIAYPRVSPAGEEQARLVVTTSDHTVVNDVDSTDRWRIGVPLDSSDHEVAGIFPSNGTLFGPAELAAALAAAEAHEIPYQDTFSGTGPQRRLIARTRQTYCSDDLSAELPPGQIGARSLPWRVYRQAFAAGHVAALFGDLVGDDLLREAGYVQLDGQPEWWAPSARHVYDAERFYLPAGYVDPFGSAWQQDYDQYSLLPTRTVDPLGNTIQAQINYRVLRPWLLTDPNGNRSGVRYDPLGVVVATAVMGKPGRGEGDALDLSTVELSPADDPTTYLAYDLTVQPVNYRMYAREQHGAVNPRWQETHVYVDGTGRVILTKTQGEPGDDGMPRWVGTGRTIYDNKGNPIKQYEPYFAPDGGFEPEPAFRQYGVTPILHYDPLSRLVATDFPDGTLSRVAFDAWQHDNWDRNDTVLDSRWYAERRDLPESDPQGRAAALTMAHAGTFTRTSFDSLGRDYITTLDNGGGHLLSTTVIRDVQGNELTVLDARGVQVLTQRFDMLGHPAHTVSADAGERRSLLDVLGKPLFGWDGRGTVLRWQYDPLRRPTHSFGANRLRLRTFYGESLADAIDRNLRTRPYAVFDTAGLSRTTDVDFKGNVLATERRLTADPTGEPDWSGLATLTDPGVAQTTAAPLLEDSTYTATTTYDALNRPTSVTNPDGSTTRPTYNEANLLERLDVRIQNSAEWTAFITNLDYNARGQRTLLELGCGTRTRYDYEADTFRLATLTTTTADGAALQALTHTYDPVGNVLQIDDAAQQTLFFANTVVTPARFYTYEPVYRLSTAEGREHIGQTAAIQPGPYDDPPYPLPHANDAQAMRRYTETYSYDPVGNINSVVHSAGVGSWTRRHDNPVDSNRLRATSLPGDPDGTFSARYTYDANGNLTSMPHLARMDWDAENRLVTVDLGGGGTAYYQYDASGQRVRATIVNNGTTETRSYLGTTEIYRKDVAGSTVLQRQTLHVLDGTQRIALVEITTTDPTATPVQRYQFADYLGSAVLEVDDTAALLSYEEYHPYGSTSFRAATGAAQVSLKRYRFAGKEKDTETGLYYHGARYGAPWIGRWTAPDPAGDVDGPNLYQYATGNPVRMVDPDGRSGVDAVSRATGWVHRHYADIKTGVRNAGDEAANWAKKSYQELRPSQKIKQFVEIGEQSTWNQAKRNVARRLDPLSRASRRATEAEHPIARALAKAMNGSYNEGKALVLQIEENMARLKTPGDNRITKLFKAGKVSAEEALAMSKRNFLHAFDTLNAQSGTKLTRAQVEAAIDASIHEVLPEAAAAAKNGTQAAVAAGKAIAKDTKGAVSGSHLLLGVAAASTVNDLVHAGQRSIEGKDWRPLAGEMLRQAGSWGGSFAGGKVGAEAGWALGALAGTAGGPADEVTVPAGALAGRVLGSVGGAIAGGRIGEHLGHRLANYLGWN